MARFTAPADVGGVTLTAGQFEVVDGHIETPDELGPGDLAGLAANGFRPVRPTRAASPRRSRKTGGAKARAKAKVTTPLPEPAAEE